MHNQFGVVLYIAAQIYIVFGYQENHQTSDHGYQYNMDVLKSIPQPLEELLSLHVGLHNYGKRTTGTPNYGTKATKPAYDYNGEEPIDVDSDPLSLFKLGYAFARVYPTIAVDFGKSLKKKLKTLKKTDKRDCICPGDERDYNGPHSRVSHLTAPEKGTVGLKKRVSTDELIQLKADAVSADATVEKEAAIVTVTETPHLKNDKPNKKKQKPSFNNILHLLQVLNGLRMPSLNA